MSFKLHPKCDIGDELIRVMREEIAETIAAIRQPRSSAKDRIHRVRTSTKKLRAALRLIRSSKPKLYRRENQRLGSAARAFAELRDADALLGCLSSLLEHHTNSIQRAHFQPIQQALLAHRRKILPASRELNLRWRQILAALRATDRSLARRRPDIEIDDLASDLRATYKRARAGLASAQLKPSGETFHEFRKSTKAYAYQCQLLRAAWPPAMKELRRELKTLGERLGDEHDLDVLESLLGKMGRKKRTAFDQEILRATLALIGARRTELRSESIPLGQRLFADRPAAVQKRMSTWWRVARITPKPAVGEESNS